MAKAWDTLITWDLSLRTKSRNHEKNLSYDVSSHKRWHLQSQLQNKNFEKQEDVWRAQENLRFGVCAGNHTDKECSVFGIGEG
jgi:hypothetical protein